MSRTLLISDLHLPPDASPLRKTFHDFLSGPARAADTLYILGDLFEVWYGDDAGLEQYAVEARTLKALADHGVEILFQHGNRDFLVGQAFLETAGLRPIEDPVVRTLDDRPVLLSHGDQWCTSDSGYQRWRRFSRQPLTQRLFNVLPRTARRRIAGGIRGTSRASGRWKPEDITDITPAAVDEALRSSGVDIVIHGHTHRPGDHALTVDGRSCRRHVLADWRLDYCEYVEFNGGDLRRISLPAGA